MVLVTYYQYPQSIHVRLYVSSPGSLVHILPILIIVLILLHAATQGAGSVWVYVASTWQGSTVFAYMCSSTSFTALHISGDRPSVQQSAIHAGPHASPATRPTRRTHASRGVAHSPGHQNRCPPHLSHQRTPHTHHPAALHGRSPGSKSSGLHHPLPQGPFRCACHVCCDSKGRWHVSEVSVAV